MSRDDHMELITRFRCDSCRKTVDRKGTDDGKTRPPDTWRFLEIDMYRSKASDPEGAHIVALVCSPSCAAAIAQHSWSATAEPESYVAKASS